tara:strand:+ start:1632 stop:1781 length:150 start_codon:yes stop_codon:yes gene_type:complete
MNNAGLAPVANKVLQKGRRVVAIVMYKDAAMLAEARKNAQKPIFSTTTV